MSDLEKYQQEWEEKFEQRRRAHQDELQRAAEQPLTPSRPVEASSLRSALPDPAVELRVNLAGDQGLAAMDRAFFEAFGLADYFPRRLLAYPTFYTETLAEFFEPLIAYDDLSSGSKRAWLDKMIAHARQQAESSQGAAGIFGVNLPDQGCYLNGWLFAYPSGLAPRAALAEPDIYRRVLGTAAHEKLGHGFITAFSALGAEKRQLNLWRFDLARRFGLQPADTPSAVLLREKQALVHASSQLTEEGWATWIEHAMVAQLAGSAPPYSPADLWSALGPPEASLAPELGVLRQAAALVLGDEPVDSGALHAAVLVLQSASPAANDLVARQLGQPLPYVVGFLLLQKAGEQLGALCLPYLVLIAANLTYNLDQLSVPELAHILGSEFRMNVDSRLAHLARLRLAQPGDIAGLAQAAREALNLTAPAPLFKSPSRPGAGPGGVISTSL